MDGQNSLADVFRFIQIQPTRPLSSVEAISLDDTDLATALNHAADVGIRIKVADGFLADGRRSIRAVEDLSLGSLLLDGLREAQKNETATVASFLGEVGDAGALVARPGFTFDRTRLSDTLLAATVGTAGAHLELRVFAELFRVYFAVADAAAGGNTETTLADVFARPLMAPLDRPPGDSHASSELADPQLAPPDAEEVITGVAGPKVPPETAAMQELARLDHGGNLTQPAADGNPSEGRIPFTLTDVARDGLSARTTAVLRKYGLDVTVTPVHAVVTLLGDLAGLGDRHTVSSHDDLAINASPRVVSKGEAQLQAAPLPTIRPSGYATLHVVKQQIKRYEAGEIAHVENVLAGEKRVREHRRLERSEETFTFETERTRVNETELETAERFELNRETSRVLQEERQAGVELTLSGKYGPTIEFTSSAEMEANQKVEESIRNATTFSKNVVQRSLERVAERVREERIRRIIKEMEEKNLHELSNTSGQHSSGIYQFLDKIYEAQIFDYGIRQMFDFMIPEPASFLWYVDETPTAGPSFPDPPPPLERFAPNAAYIDEWNFRGIAALYGAVGVQASPPLYRTVTSLLQHGGGDDATEEGRPRSTGLLELTIPSGYRPWHATFTGLAMTDDDKPIVAVTTAHHHLLSRPAKEERIVFDAAADHHYYAVPLRLYADFTTDPIPAETDGKLVAAVVGYETNTYSLNVDLVCRRGAALLDQWRLATYAKVEAAYQERVREHQQTVAELQSQPAASVTLYGAPPLQNRQTVRDELKKHCISILTRQNYDGIRATADGSPPTFDFGRAMEEGSFTRFFEQAFEWDQLQYVCYPYYWARKKTWIERFNRQDTDPEFRDFWRAGAARVVVPARPGFEPAIRFFLEHKRLWNGSSEPSPVVTDPLYLPIVVEIQERTGANKGEIPIGEPWEVRLPTPLVLVRPTVDLPAWARVEGEGWTWRPVASGSTADESDAPTPG